MEKQKRNRIIAIAAALVLVAAVAIVAVASTSGRSEQETLAQFYKGMYETEGGGIHTVVDCLAPSIQESYFNDVTGGGTNFIIMSMWSSEATSIVGSNVKTSVKVLDSTTETAAKLNAVKQNYGEAEAFHTVAFQLTLTGDNSTEEFVGAVSMIRTGGDWYMLDTNTNMRHLVSSTEEAE